jgi:hypothetical protein
MIPDAPQDLKPDPKSEDPVNVQIAALGTWGGSRDFGVWEGVRPDNSDDANKAVWLWFNKSDISPNHVRIDLENFQRGHNQENPKKGRVLFYATMLEKPNFQSFQRVAGSGHESFAGFYGSGTYAEQDDTFYCQHGAAQQGIHAHRVLGRVIAKWSFNTSVLIYDGELGRGEGTMMGKPITMEVYAKGTAVATYEEWHERVENRNDEGHHMEVRRQKSVAELVDRIEYRLSCNNQFWTQWFVEGDTFSYGNAADTTIDSPLFNTTVGGGWFTRTKFTTRTCSGVDPALAMLISHVCATEYSVAQVKADLHIHFPQHFPGMCGYLGSGFTGMQLTHPERTYDGTFTFH